MRLSKRSFGACTLACVAFPALSLAWLGCARDGGASKGDVTESAPQALQNEQTTVVAWGHGLTYLPGGKEAHNRGPESFTFNQTGTGFLVLDSLASRIVDVGPHGEVHLFAHDLPQDADGIAISPQGEVAVHRGLKLQVQVYNTRGDLAGLVPVPEGARDANIVHLLSQGRVMLEHPYQERYLLGSPNVPRQPETILPSRREGVSGGFEAGGFQVVVRHPDGGTMEDVDPAIARLGAGPARAGSHAYLTRLEPVGEAEQGSRRYKSRTIADLGEASSGRIFGVQGTTVCTVLEHVDMAATVVDVKREVVCTAGQDKAIEKARFHIETSSLYKPRQDIVFNGKQVAYAVPTEQGLVIRTIGLSEVTK